MRRVHSVRMAAAAALLLAVPSPAGAAGGAQTDGTGDVNDPRGDITQVTADWVGTTVTLTMQTTAAEAPGNANWVDGDTGAYWFVKTDTGKRYDISFEQFDSSGPESVTSDEATEDDLCENQASVRDGAYVVELESRCLRDPGSFTVQGEMLYNDVAKKTDTADYAPDGAPGSAFCCPTTRS